MNKNEFMWIKPKSLDDILFSMKDKSLEDIFIDAVRNGYVELAKHCVKNGLDISDYYLMILNGKYVLN